MLRSLASACTRPVSDGSNPCTASLSTLLPSVPIITSQTQRTERYRTWNLTRRTWVSTIRSTVCRPCPRCSKWPSVARAYTPVEPTPPELQPGLASTILQLAMSPSLGARFSSVACTRRTDVYPGAASYSVRCHRFRCRDRQYSGRQRCLLPHVHAAMPLKVDGIPHPVVIMAILLGFHSYCSRAMRRQDKQAPKHDQRGSPAVV